MQAHVVKLSSVVGAIELQLSPWQASKMCLTAAAATAGLLARRGAGGLPQTRHCHNPLPGRPGSFPAC